MKNIAFFIEDLKPMGGLEKITISLANELAKIGYQVTIISLMPFDKPYFETNKNIKNLHLETRIHPLAFKYKIPLVPWFIHTIYRLNKIITENKIDILISSGVRLNSLCIPIKFWSKNLKIISWDHGSYTNQAFWHLRGRKIAKKYADAIIVLTQQNKDLYLEDGKFNAPIFVINNFMDNYPNIVSTLKSKVALVVGRYHKVKRFDILIDIWEKVKQNSISKEWVLKIVGDGPEKNNIRKIISDKNLEKSVILVDATPNVSQYYLDASFFLMTSRLEGMPLVLIEAQSYGVPIVAFDCPVGPRGIIKNGEDGFLISMDDEKDMMQKIVELMQNTELRVTIGKKARENSQRFKKDHIVKKWIDLFEYLKR